MRLTEIRLEGYRSVASDLRIRVQEEVTCLIGANEHGKSNILAAANLLPRGHFEQYDKNTHSRTQNHPRVTYSLRLNSTDRRQLVEALAHDIDALGEPGKGTDEEKTLYVARSLKDYYGGKRELLLIQLTAHGSRRVLFGKGGSVPVAPKHARLPHLSAWFESSMPRVVLFEPGQELADTVTLAQLEERANLPFEGLLKLAGVWERRAELFEMDLKAHQLHDEAGRRLTRKLRRIWTQGGSLEFQFHSAAPQLALRIKDPVTFDTPSLRSLGLRSFLSFYLTLYAETEEIDPEGFILLFDEPGLHLHPQGQKDLLRELRKLGQRNQIIYATHSPFLIDRNEPTSVILVTKGTSKKERGTQVAYKPYGRNWRDLTDALGIVPADAFFPPDRALLVEGSSDRLYISTYMRILSDRIKADLNFLSIVDADRRDELPAFVTILLAADRELVVVTDSDQGGRDFEKHLKRLAGKRRKTALQFIDYRGLTGRSDRTTVEDLMPEEPWLRAVNKYVANVLEADLQIDKQLLTDSNLPRVETVARHLAGAGILDRSDRFSRTTVAHLFGQEELEIPDKDSPVFRLCEQIVTKLGIAR